MDPSKETPPADAALYRIVVKGRLAESWWERLAGLRVVPGEKGRGEATTTILEGPVRDQTELSGILNTLYELHLPIVSVEALGEE